MNKMIWLLWMSFVCVSCAQAGSDADRVCFPSGCVKVEIVSTPEAMARGLQHRERLGEDDGMLFMFSMEGRHAFWMKETLIPLDMIWLDQQRRIVHIEHATKPCPSEPCAIYEPQTDDALYVLETNAGYAGKHHWKEGDQATFLIKD